MARTKSERGRPKPLAADDLSQSIQQLQGFIPKLEDLGREGFPYLEGALARTELQLRECIKRAFGDKSAEFQSHRHLKIALSTPSEKKQTLGLIRGLVNALEEKKCELRGIKPRMQEEPASSFNAPQLALVPPVGVPTKHPVTSAMPASHSGDTLRLVPSLDHPPMNAVPDTAGAPATPAPSPMTMIAPPPDVPVMPPRTPIEPISSLFRSQEVKIATPISPTPISDPTPLPAVEATVDTRPAVSVAAAGARSAPEPPSSITTSAPTMSSARSTVSNPASATESEEPPGLPYSTTPQIPVAVPSAVSSSAPSQTSPCIPALPPQTAPLAVVKQISQRFHAVARQLRLRGEYRSTVTIDDELDVQDLFHALLRQHFDDIGTDDWTPDYSHGAARTTFLLDHDRFAFVVKKTRSGLSRKDLVDQVRADAERYRARGRCIQLLCFIYDPEGRVGNPRGLESELSQTTEHFSIDVIVAPK